MTILSLLLTLAIAGAIVYLITLIPMPPVFKNVIIVIATIFLLLYVLQSFGVTTGFGPVRFK